MTYEELLFHSDNEGITVKEKNILGSNGRIKGKRIAIRSALPNTEKSCVLAEELGHYYTTVGNILDQSTVGNRKQELRARLWAYNCQIGLRGIIKAFDRNCKNTHEMAEYLDVTEEFLKEAITAYRNKYGICAEFDNYIIFFEPHLAVLKKVSD